MADMKARGWGRIINVASIYGLKGAANRVGYEGPPGHGIEFWGSSFVADPFGQIAAEASNDKEEILVVECDPAKSEDTRRNWPFLRDRRIDAYGPILNRWLGE